MLQESLQKYVEAKSISLPELPAIFRTAKGKPYVLSSSSLHVGVSHTEDVVAVAVSRYNFGIDMEHKNRPLHKMDAIIRRYFSKGEKAFVSGDGPEETRKRFLSVWVQKEAYIKYLGTGLSHLSKADTQSLPGQFYVAEHGSYILSVYAEKFMSPPKEVNVLAPDFNFG